MQRFIVPAGRAWWSWISRNNSRGTYWTWDRWNEGRAEITCRKERRKQKQSKKVVQPFQEASRSVPELICSCLNTHLSFVWVLQAQILHIQEQNSTDLSLNYWSYVVSSLFMSVLNFYLCFLTCSSCIDLYFSPIYICCHVQKHQGQVLICENLLCNKLDSCFLLSWWTEVCFSFNCRKKRNNASEIEENSQFM